MNEINRPLFSILNPEFTYSVYKYQTACGIEDIMMHTLERYFSDPVSAELTDRLAEGILKSVISSGEVVWECP
jgi:alcohol dehydrogenase YqhD (iron-dependent ADH family)